LTNYPEVKKDFVLAKKIEASKKGNQNVFLQLDEGFYLLSDSWIRLNSKNDLVLVDDETIVPAKTLNNLIKRNQIMGMTPLGPGSKAKYAIYTTEQTQNDGQKTINPIEIHINKNGKLLFQNKIVPLEDLKGELAKINDHLSFEERKKTIRSIINAEATTPKDVIQKVDGIFEEYGSATINIVGPKMLGQSSATREEMKEYNTLAKKYNAMDRNHMIIKKDEVMRLKTIYGKMSEKQRNDAEPFPDFPPPPPAPPAIGEPEPPKSPLSTTEVKEVSTPAPQMPPAPPAPKSPLEHIKEMADKGATFTLNGKEISAKEAMRTVQKNNKINIDIRGTKGDNPIVKLSVDPIEIDN